MVKTKKVVALTLCCLLGLALIISFVILGKQTKDRSVKASTVVTLSGVPIVQLVLNENQKVMEATSLNDDGRKLLLTNDLRGYDYKEASTEYAKLCVDAGYIDSSSESSGSVIEVSLTGTLEDYSFYSDELETAINDYFYANGIIAIAISNILDSIKDVMTDLYPAVENIDAVTDEQKMQVYVKLLHDLKDVTSDKYNEFLTFYDTIRVPFETHFSLETDFSKYANSISDFEKEFNEKYKTSEKADTVPDISSFLDFPNSKNLVELKLHYDNMDSVISKLSGKPKKLAKEILKNLKVDIEKEQTEVDEARVEFDSKYSEFVNQLKDESKEMLLTLKEEIGKQIEDNLETVETNKKYFQNHREEVIEKIKQYRDLFEEEV